ncbi:hypothetical protein BMF94_4597 [Rhodotorula taiwanensis]|uniref:Uncharacterized protein n=1 Tax=Rhodotorula taiwanensis TaxID=741276 RepID=A0A2S5B6D2_9BASI|nr:hypothetical protein BMF94_4597 [Rhodotorula taiwanensis]
MAGVTGFDARQGQLKRLLRHYAALSPATPTNIRLAVLSDADYLSRPTTQQWVVDNLIAFEGAKNEQEDDDDEEERGAKRWKGRFWRRMVDQINEGFAERRAAGDIAVEDEEPHPDILETFVLYLSSAGSTDSAPGVSRRTYYWGPLDQPVQSWERIVTKEEGKLISGACVALSNHLLADPRTVERHEHVIELGSGVGLLSLVCARLSRRETSPAKRRRIVATDVDDKVLEMLEANIAESEPCDDFTLGIECVSDRTFALKKDGFEDIVRASPLDWELVADADKNRDELALWEMKTWSGGPRASLILGADIVYDPSLVDPLAATLAWLLRAEPGAGSAPEALIAGTVRNEVTWASFLDACRARHLNVTAVQMTAPPQDGGIVGAEGWEGEGEIRLVRITSSEVL